LVLGLPPEVLDGGVEAYLGSELFPIALSKGRSTA
jgi:hypothetical protein